MIEKEYIDLEETVTALKRNSQKYFSSFHKGYVQAIEDLADIPAAKVAPVRHGHWIEQENWALDDYYYTCSACGTEWVTIEGTPEENGMDFCPNCGAKMDGKEREEND